MFRSLEDIGKLVQIFEAEKWPGKCTFYKDYRLWRRERIGNEKG